MKESTISAIGNVPLVLDKNSRDKQFKEENIDEISDEILAQYPEGIKSLIDAEKPRDEEVYTLMIIKCPHGFYEKYSKKSLTSMKTYKFFAAAQNVANSGELTSNEVNEVEMGATEANLITVDDDKLIDKVERKLKEYNKYKDMMHSVFESFDKTFDDLLDIVIDKYITKCEENLKQKNKAKYDTLHSISMAKFNTKYIDFKYESFIVVFCSIISYYSSLKLKIDFSEAKNELMLYVSGDEEIFDKLAQYFDYELQVAPYALKVVKKQSKNESSEEEKYVLLDAIIKENSPMQFEDYDINNVACWPPYFVFKSQKKNKYRRYTKSDDFHECDHCRENKCESSKYRNIDKLRLIFRRLDYLLKFSNMYHLNLLHMILFNRNYLSYKDKLTQSSANPFNIKKNDSMINTMRNYFGENVSFFFLWLDTYTRWLIFPSIIGILLTVMYYTKERVPLVDIFSSSVHMDYYDFCLILFCVIIALWLSLYTNIWEQKEKIYGYIWGMEDLEKSSPVNEEFVPNEKEELIFGYEIPIESTFRHRFKKFVSNLVLIAMVGVVCFIVYYLFRLKATMVNGDEYHDFIVAIKIASINGVQIKVMNLIYYYLASYLNAWENHYLIKKKDNSLAIKLILFDFVNSYSALFYIAFIKPYNEGCQYGNCLKEIEMQIYTIFLIYIGLYVLAILYPMAVQYYNLSQITKMLSRDKTSSSYRIQLSPQSIEHQVICYRITTMNFEYNDIVIQFGYVCLFSVAAPLTPLIMFVLAMLGRVVNYYKIINLERVEFVEGAKGIEVYNKVIRIMFFIGMMVNVAIVLFSSPHFATITLTATQIKSKLLIFAVVENLVLVIMFYVNWNILPKWFRHIKLIKEIYQNKIMLRESRKKKMSEDNEIKTSKIE